MILIRLVCRGSSSFRVQEFRDYTDLVSYVTQDWYFSSGGRCQEPFCLQSISDNAGEAFFVKYVIGNRYLSGMYGSSLP